MQIHQVTLRGSIKKVIASKKKQKVEVNWNYASFMRAFDGSIAKFYFVNPFNFLASADI